MDIASVLLWVKIGVVFYVLTIIAFIDIMFKDFGTGGKKAVWAVISLIPFIGWLIYLIFGYRKGKRSSKEENQTN